MSEAQEQQFVEQVRTSWKIHKDLSYASTVDEIVLGTVITGAVWVGYSLIDLNSDGTNHHLRFENVRSRERLTFKLNHLTGSLETAKVLGHLADITIAYGRPVNDTGKLWSSFKQELKSSFLMRQEPGTITVDADLTAGYLYAQVGLIWPLDEYFEAPYKPDFAKISNDIECTRVALAKYLDGRIGQEG